MTRLIVLLGVVMGSLSSVFVRWSTAPSLILVFYRMTLSILLLAPAAWQIRKDFALMTRRELLLCAGSGVALGLHFATYFEALKATSIASVSVLVCMEVLFVALITVLVLRQRLSGKVWVSILLAFGGAVLVALAGSSGGGGAARGNLLALTAALCMAIYTMIGAVCRRTMSTSAYTFLVYFAAGITVLILSLLGGVPLFGYGAVNYATSLGMAVCCTLLCHSVLSWGLKYLSPPFISMIKLMDPICGFGWGLVLFGERPGPLVLVGGAVIILGIALYNRAAAGEP